MTSTAGRSAIALLAPAAGIVETREETGIDHKLLADRQRCETRGRARPEVVYETLEKYRLAMALSLTDVILLADLHQLSSVVEMTALADKAMGQLRNASFGGPDVETMATVLWNMAYEENQGTTDLRTWAKAQLMRPNMISNLCLCEVFRKYMEDDVFWKFMVGWVRHILGLENDVNLEAVVRLLWTSFIPCQPRRV